MTPWRLTTIVSGATAGAERGALDAAIELDLQYGGWREHGGDVPAIYATRMREHPFAGNGMVRRLNVQDSDGTLIVSLVAELAGPAAFVDRAVEAQRKASMHIVLPAGGNSQVPESLAQQVRDWIREDRVSVLNVAGPGEDEEPGIQQATHDFIVWVFEDA